MKQASAMIQPWHLSENEWCAFDSFCKAMTPWRCSYLTNLWTLVSVLHNNLSMSLFQIWQIAECICRLSLLQEGSLQSLFNCCAFMRKLKLSHCPSHAAWAVLGLFHHELAKLGGVLAYRCLDHFSAPKTTSRFCAIHELLKPGVICFWQIDCPLDLVYVVSLLPVNLVRLWICNNLAGQLAMTQLPQ